jgi:hypothetical protein
MRLEASGYAAGSTSLAEKATVVGARLKVNLQWEGLLEERV